VAGKDLSRLSNWKLPHHRRLIGTVFQDFRLLPNKTVHQNVSFALEVIGKPKGHINKVVPEVLDLVGLDGKEDRLPSELSGGEQQRVAVARAFVNRPMILIADEPTGNLDPETSVGIMKLLDRINRTGTTVVMVTHDQAICEPDAQAGARSSIRATSCATRPAACTATCANRRRPLAAGPVRPTTRRLLQGIDRHADPVRTPRNRPRPATQPDDGDRPSSSPPPSR